MFNSSWNEYMTCTYLALNKDRSINFTRLSVWAVCVCSIVSVTYVWNGIAHLAGSLYIRSYWKLERTKKKKKNKKNSKSSCVLQHIKFHRLRMEQINKRNIASFNVNIFNWYSHGRIWCVCVHFFVLLFAPKMSYALMRQCEGWEIFHLILQQRST